MSSEANADFLRFYRGDVEVASLSGEVNWRTEAFELPDGQQTLRWEYTKNSNVSVGLDRGGLDSIAISSGAPVINQAPQNQVVLTGDSVTFGVSAAGFQPLTYQWFKDGATIPGATDPILRLGNAQTADPSRYSVMVSNRLGAVTTPGATWTVTSPIPLVEALDKPNLVWTTGGNSSWLGYPRGAFPVASDGIDAAKSALITHGQESWIQTTVTGPVTLQFWWKVSSEKDSDFLRLFVGETEVARISGETDWRPESAVIPAGKQSVRWKYSKDASGSAGLDRAWLDQVEVLATPEIIEPPASRVAWEGSTVNFGVSVAWDFPLSYQWLKDDEIIPEQTRPYLVLPNVSAKDNGKYSVVVSNRAGSTTSEPATLVVRTPPESFLRILARPPAPALSIKTTAGKRFVLESNDSLSPTEWREIDSVAGDGTVRTFRDLRPAASSRFYRVRME